MDSAIDDLAFKMGIQGRYLDLVNNFAEAQGDEGCLEVLERVKQTRDHQKRQGLRVDSAVSLWTRYSEQYVKKVEGTKYQQNQAAERERLNEAYYKSIAEDYQPTVKTIRAALDELLALGEITKKEHEVACRSGLDCVHDMTGVPEPKEAPGPLEADEELTEMFSA